MGDLLRFCGFPPEDMLASDSGLPLNHEYGDMRRIGRADFHALWDLEEEMAAAGVHLLPNPHDSEREWFDEGVWTGSIDCFVGSTVFALSVAGAAPYTSCCGREGHAESHPVVAFWCPPELLALVERAAAATGVNLDGVDNSDIYPPEVRADGLLLWVPYDLLRMHAFAAELVRSLPPAPPVPAPGGPA